MHNAVTAPAEVQPRFSLAEIEGISDEVSGLLILAAEGNALARAQLETAQHITLEHIADQDFEVVQRCFMTIHTV